MYPITPNKTFKTVEHKRVKSRIIRLESSILNGENVNTNPSFTISRQLGSLGSEIARDLAECLGFRLVWRELINEAARAAKAPEMALATIDDLGLLKITPSLQERQAYQAAAAEAMRDLVMQGNVVIIGRAGQAILRDERGVLHIRVIAPPTVRCERLAERYKISLEAATAQIQASDKARKNYCKRNYGIDWDDPQLYDLVVNTGRIEPGQAVKMICNLARV